MDFTGYAKDYDHDTGELTLLLTFLTPENHEELERWIISEESQHFNGTNVRRKAHRYNHLQMWFASVDAILRHYNVPVKPKYRLSMHRRCVEMCMPTTKIEELNVGGEIITAIPSLHLGSRDVDADILIEGTRRLHSIFSRKGVKFKNQLHDGDDII